ncbi:hypothetical protein DPV92_05550 [Haemophilus paraphrohaemolyticus]|uniref:Pyruvate formate lyase-activating protein n=1 Tax=Haemophilus paraphrohaemolyticus TaxID=736 RepID=A0A369ZNF2_9PAST|nr:hypothetical protein [Haemophilus paraphrohaemolyticus]RDF10461.1 hypothetical protein DPV92_05550 [Haemophilus paraphrohaemolyticus]
MRYKALFTLLFTLLSGNALSDWKKINDLDYTWGPFKIYNISLFTETGEYQPNIRPLMLSLKYDKPVDGRDFAISIARSWARLEIKLSNQEVIIDRLRKTLPDLKPGDMLYYVALADRGYFIVNNQVITGEFDKATNDAILAIWLDPKVDLSHKLIVKKTNGSQNIHIAEYDPEDSDEINVVSPLLEEKNSKPSPELSDKTATTEQAVDLEPENVNEKVKMHKQPVVGVPDKAIVEPVKVESTPETKNAQAVENVAEVATEEAEKQPAQDARKAQQDELKLEQKSEDKVDPENPEIDIRPIEDPMPDNIRAS